MELISRADAIKDAESWVAVDEHERRLQKNVIEWLKEFPPAELSTNLAEVGTDCISRRQAIDAIKERYYKYGRFAKIEELVWSIEKLPPIQPKTGKWIIDRSGAYCCSQCMEPCAGYVMMKPRDKFCKMCGAKMEVTTNA